MNNIEQTCAAQSMEQLIVTITPEMLAEIADFEWFRYLDRPAAIRFLLQQGLATQRDIRTPWGDRRQNPDEVVVDCRF